MSNDARRELGPVAARRSCEGRDRRRRTARVRAPRRERASGGDCSRGDGEVTQGGDDKVSDSPPTMRSNAGGGASGRSGCSSRAFSGSPPTSSPGPGERRPVGQARALPVASPRPTAVTTAAVRRGDVHVYVTALGSVLPVNTVTVRSRVDGELMAVHFKEGDLVQGGDLLAEIDRRPFEVQLTQAEGQLAKDQAFAGQRPQGSRAVSDALRRGLDREPAGRHAGVPGSPVRGNRQGRSGPDRRRQAPARLLPHHRAVQRAGRDCGSSIPATSSGRATPTVSS